MHRPLILIIVAALGCGGGSKPEPAPPAREHGPAASLTAQQCTDAGGEVVGDIGDGAIHKPEYRCEKSGAPPIGPIASEPGAPAAIEGAVCCK